MRSNVAVVNTEETHEGGRASAQAPQHQLVRQVATCMLFEDTFYERGSVIAASIAETCKHVPVAQIAAVAIQAREDFKLRHVPLFLLAQLDLRRSEAKGLLARTVERVVQRPDEMGELLSIIQRVNPGKPLKKVLSAQVKKGLARAFRKFSAYSLAKWNRDTAIKLRDVLFLSHAKPKDAEQAATWKQLVDGTLPTPDTWEVALSSGKDKKETWERLISDGKLGAFALLMNLRNMEQVGVSRSVVMGALRSADTKGILPYRFLAALRHAPAYAQGLEVAMLSGLKDAEPLRGSTVILVDISPSMNDRLSAKSEMTRLDAASALAIYLRETGEDVRVWTFSEKLAEVPAHRGLGLVSAIVQSGPRNGTYLRGALAELERRVPSPDRIIVVTDEQSHDGIHPAWSAHPYLVNVAPYAPGLNTHSGWNRINGFSERIVDFIRWEESEAPAA